MINPITKLSFIFAFVCLILNAKAQTEAGRFQFSAGVGLAPTFVADNAEVKTPPLHLTAGYYITPFLGLSAFAGYSSSTSASPIIISDGKYTLINNKQYLFGLRGEVRKTISEKFDFYGGGMLGYNHADVNEFDPLTGETYERNPEGPSPFDPDKDNGKLLYSGFVGGSYYFNGTIGMFLEAGYGVSLLNTGIKLRL